MKKQAYLCLVALVCAVFTIAALVSAETAPVGIRQFFQTAPKETAPQGTTSIVTVRGNEIRRFPLLSTASILPYATATTPGVFKVGTGLSMLNGVLNNTGVAGVASFGTPPRGGAVVPQAGDYSISQITGAATVATSGSYADLLNKPVYSTVATSGSYADLLNKPTLATVATSGSYSDLTNKPTIPTTLSQLSGDTTHRTVTDVEKTQWNNNSSPVTTVFGRAGNITAQTGDYTAAMVGADIVGSATSVITGHEGTYNHANLPTTAEKGAMVGTGGTPGVANPWVTKNTHDNYSTAKGIKDAAQDSAIAVKAPIASPTFTGTPAAPTAATGTSTTQLATTQFVANALAPVTYTPVSPLTVTYGTLIFGAYTDLAAAGGTTVEVQEASGANALQVIINFSGVTSFNQVLLRGYYSGGVGHQVQVEIYNTTSGAWDVLDLWTTTTAPRWYGYSIVNSTDYLNSGAAQVRLRHLESGINTHHLYLDVVNLRLDSLAGGGITEHNALGGRSIAGAHPISAITDLQTTLDGKEPADSTIIKEGESGESLTGITPEQVGARPSDRLRIALWSDLHFEHVDATQPLAGTPSLTAAANDIANNVPVDFLMTVGDNAAGGKSTWPSYKTFLYNNFLSQGIPATQAEGNHDAQLYGSTVEGKIDGVSNSWQAWYTKYPYVETTPTGSVSIGATSIALTSTAGMSASEPIFFWNEATQTGEGKRIASIVGNTVNLQAAFTNAFDTTTKVFQGRDRDYLYTNLRDIWGTGDSDLGGYGTSRVVEYGNNVFITLNMETFYDNPSFTSYQMHTSDRALDWLESKLKKYADRNVFVLHHPLINGSGIKTTWSQNNPIGYLDGNSARIKTICQTYPIRAWFTGHAHFPLDNTQGDVNAVRVNTPADFGGTTFIGVPSVGRVAHSIPYANSRAWWYYLEFTEGAASVTVKVRNSTDLIWEDADTVISLVHTVKTEFRNQFPGHEHTNKPVLEKFSESATGEVLYDGSTLASGTVIDDTKGNGDTDFTWSADKIYDQLATKQAAGNYLTTSATTADVPDSADKRYVTDAQKTVIGNTAGTNSGDESQASILSKLSTSTDGAELSIVQGATEAVTAVKQVFKNAAGVVQSWFNAAGQFRYGAEAPALLSPVPALYVEMPSSGTTLGFASYGSNGSIIGVLAAGGTKASPAVTPNNGIMGGLSFRGAYEVVGGVPTWVTGSKAHIFAYAAEAWNSTSQGTYIDFGTTKKGTTTKAVVLRIQDDGNIGVGTTAPSEKLEVNGNVKAKVFAPAIPAAATDGATVTFDLAAGDSPSVTLGGNRTLAFSNPVVGSWYSLKLIQDATGSRTVTWPSSGLVCTFIKSDGTTTATGPTLHTAANTVDTIVIHVKSATTADCWAAGY